MSPADVAPHSSIRVVLRGEGERTSQTDCTLRMLVQECAVNCMILQVVHHQVPFRPLHALLRACVPCRLP